MSEVKIAREDINKNQYGAYYKDGAPSVGREPTYVSEDLFIDQEICFFPRRLIWLHSDLIPWSAASPDYMYIGRREGSYV